jgi:peptidoglycan/xylan/chitin deacetylase (PgdA/CDA1 family)
VELGPAVRDGTARHVAPTALVLDLPAAALHLQPGRYGWSARTVWSDRTACSSPCRDAAPDRGWFRARLARLEPVGCRIAGSHYRTNGSRRRRVVALTFDDGPAAITPRFVDVLERERVAATFFLLGRQVPGHDALLRRELGDGFALGDHSMTHANLAGGGPGTEREVAEPVGIIRRASGYRPCLFRAPYGAVSSALIARAYAHDLETIEWDVDPRDWSRPGTDAIVGRVLGAVRPGSIVLMHDGGGPRGESLAALPRIIRGLRARGYGFVTVPSLLGFSTRYVLR